MQLIQKRLISISGFAVFIFFGYLAFQNFTSSQLDEPTIPVSQSGISVVDNTGKIISGSTATISGTWADSPFGSGKPLTGEEKPLFKMPNTEWKTRTLNINGKWLTYEYGKGNPNSIILPDSALKGCSYQESSEYCTDGAGYVTDEVESFLLKMLSDPNWKSLLTQCEKEFRETDLRQGNSGLITFDMLHDGSFLSLENFLIINPDTGRKELSRIISNGAPKILFLRFYLENSTWFHHAGGLGGIIEPNYSKCVDTYGTSIINQITNTIGFYLSPRNMIFSDSGKQENKLNQPIPDMLPLGTHPPSN